MNTIGGVQTSGSLPTCVMLDAVQRTSEGSYMHTRTLMRTSQSISA